jgi:hypothetical protein
VSVVLTLTEVSVGTFQYIFTFNLPVDTGDGTPTSVIVYYVEASNYDDVQHAHFAYVLWIIVKLVVQSGSFRTFCLLCCADLALVPSPKGLVFVKKGTPVVTTSCGRLTFRTHTKTQPVRLLTSPVRTTRLQHCQSACVFVTRGTMTEIHCRRQLHLLY